MFDAPTPAGSGRQVAVAAAGFDVSGLDNDGLLGFASDLSAMIHAAEAARLHALAELEARKLTVRRHGLFTNGWLAADGVIPKAVANAQVRTARLLRLYPGVDAAVTAGRINHNHARLLCRAAQHPRVGDQINGRLDDLIALASSTTDFDRFARELAGLVTLLDQDGGYDPDRDPNANRLHLSRTGDELLVRGEFHGTAGEEIEEQFALLRDRLTARLEHDRGAGVDLDIPGPVQLNALALAEALRVAAGSPDTGGGGRGANAHITVLLDPESGQGLSTRTGNVLSPKFVQWLAGDALWDALHVDADGTPLWMGREVRYATPEQRRAILARDGGCPFANCQVLNTHFVAHHLDHWDNGGPTDIDNLPGPCAWHHWLTHQPGWSMGTDEDGWFYWTAPNGTIIPSQRHGRTKEQHRAWQKAKRQPQDRQQE